MNARISDMTLLSALGEDSVVPVVKDGVNYGFDLGDALPFYCDQHGIEPGNSAAENVTALRLLIDRAEATGRSIVVRENLIDLDENITMPVGLNTCPSIWGTGWNSGFRFQGAAVDRGFDFFDSSVAAGTYETSGGLFDLNIRCQTGAKRGASWKRIQSGMCWRVRFDGIAGAAADFYDTLNTTMSNCLLVGCGSASECAVQVGGTNSSSAGSTTWLWLQNYVSGGLAAGGTTKKGGLSIDRCINAAVLGGAIESTGTPIIIGGTASGDGELTSGTRPVQGVMIGGGLDLENPGNGNPYIDIGNGWTGTAGAGVGGLVLDAISASPTGSTTIPYGARIEDCNTFEASSGCHLPPINGTSSFEFIGTANSGMIVRANHRAYLQAWPWVRVDGVMRPDASPQADWFSSQTNVMNVAKTTGPTATTNHLDLGAALSCLLFTTQGGIVKNHRLTNTGATTVNSMSGGRDGAEIVITSTNSNTTLGQNVGSDGFRLTGGVDLPLVANTPYRFIYDGNLGDWSQM